MIASWSEEPWRRLGQLNDSNTITRQAKKVDKGSSREYSNQSQLYREQFKLRHCDSRYLNKHKPDSHYRSYYTQLSVIISFFLTCLAEPMGDRLWRKHIKCKTHWVTYICYIQVNHFNVNNNPEFCWIQSRKETKKNLNIEKHTQLAWSGLCFHPSWKNPEAIIHFLKLSHLQFFFPKFTLISLFFFSSSLRACWITKCESSESFPIFILFAFFSCMLLKCSTFKRRILKNLRGKLNFSLFFCGLAASCPTLPPLYKGKGCWLVIDSTEVFKSDRLKALYIIGWPDGWLRVQGWSLRIQSKALSILTMLTCWTLTWWADFFPHVLFATATFVTVASNGHRVRISPILTHLIVCHFTKSPWKLESCLVSQKANKLCVQQLSTEL